MSKFLADGSLLVSGSLGGGATEIGIIGDGNIATVFNLTNSNPLATALVDANGDVITSFGGGIQYVDGTVDLSPTGTLLMGYDDSNQIQALSSTPEGYLRSQPILPVLDTAPATLNVGNEGVSIDVSQYGNLTVQLVVTGLGTSVTVRLEGSLDGTNWWNFNTNNQDILVQTSVTAIKQQGISADKFIRLVFVSADGGTPSISYRVFAR